MQETGQHGEMLAAAYLKSKGYSITTTNWRYAHWEIDIIAHHEGVLVFVEVRTRHAKTTERAFESVTSRKQDNMLKAVYAYLECEHLPDDTLWRVDLVGVALWRNADPRIQHVEDALGW